MGGLRAMAQSAAHDPLLSRRRQIPEQAWKSNGERLMTPITSPRISDEAVAECRTLHRKPTGKWREGVQPWGKPLAQTKLGSPSSPKVWGCVVTLDRTVGGNFPPQVNDSAQALIESQDSL